MPQLQRRKWHYDNYPSTMVFNTRSSLKFAFVFSNNRGLITIKTDISNKSENIKISHHETPNKTIVQMTLAIFVIIWKLLKRWNLRSKKIYEQSNYWPQEEHKWRRVCANVSPSLLKSIFSTIKCRDDVNTSKV